LWPHVLLLDSISTFLHGHAVQEDNVALGGNIEGVDKLVAEELGGLELVVNLNPTFIDV